MASCLRVAEAFRRFGPMFKRWIHSRLEGCGVSDARLRLIHALNCQGPQIMTGLSDELGVTPRNVTALVDGLEAEGLVRRKAHASDRRKTLIELTPAGADLARRAARRQQEAFAELFLDLSERDRRELVRLLERLQAALAKRSGDL
jgi:DNA-binding MarR family transcriptional regulator